jgi:hypothetical protein
MKKFISILSGILCFAVGPARRFFICSERIISHEDLATTQIYSHLQQQNLRDAVNLL